MVSQPERCGHLGAVQYSSLYAPPPGQTPQGTLPYIGSKLEEIAPFLALDKGKFPLALLQSTPRINQLKFWP
jgi:hypothetical protein